MEWVKLFNCNFGFLFSGAISERSKIEVFKLVEEALVDILGSKGNIYSDSFDNSLFGPSVRVTGISFESDKGRAHIKLDKESRKESIVEEEKKIYVSKTSTLYGIEKKVSMPKGASWGGIRKFPLKEMEIGDSFFVPIIDYPKYKKLRPIKLGMKNLRSNLSSSVTSAKKTGLVGKSFRVSMHTEDKGVRVWRVE